MDQGQNISLNIVHKDDYKVLYIIFSENFTNNDVNTTIVMLQNFFDNCNKNKIKFAWVFNCKKLKGISLMALETFSKFCRTNFNTIKENLICNCLISSEGLFNQFFGIFTKIYKPTKPLINFSELEKCDDFIEDCLNGKYKNDTIIY
tara:strand:+ start:1100 stop:1540 length:441 start_codon:yes stop_codon:yes gene_type:complete